MTVVVVAGVVVVASVFGFVDFGLVVVVVVVVDDAGVVVVVVVGVGLGAVGGCCGCFVVTLAEVVVVVVVVAVVVAVVVGFGAGVGTTVNKCAGTAPDCCLEIAIRRSSSIDLAFAIHSFALHVQPRHYLQ